MSLETSLLWLRPLEAIASSSSASRLASFVIDGDLKSALLSPEARAYLSRPSRYGVQDLVAEVGGGGGANDDSDGQDEEEQQGVALVVGVACLHAFIQQNWTGPSLEFAPREILPWVGGDDAAPAAVDNDDTLHRATIPLLARDGEPAYHLARHPTLLLVALRIFASLRGGRSPLWSVDWWRLRAAMVHQSLLDEPVPYDDGLQASLERLLETQRSGSTSLKLPDELLATLALEIGLSHHVIAQDRQAGAFFVQAAKLDGLEYHLTGALGKRTKFQVNELSQLVLLAKSRPRDGSAAEPAAPAPETLALNDDTLLEQTEFTSTAIDSKGVSTIPASLVDLNPQDQPALEPLDQALLIDMCLAQHNTTPENGLTASQMAPYLARVISHPRNWSIHTTALLLRARLEAKRSRTVERSALQLQALVDQMPTADSALKERLLYFHQLPLPSKWEMERELAQRFLSLGVVRSALEIFERLEMWEEAVRCHVNMDRSDRAMEIVQELLEGTKQESDIVTTRQKLEVNQAQAGRRHRIDAARQAKLLCLMGDLQPDRAEACYSRAWEVSQHTSSRSRRSLAGIYLGKDDFAKAIPLLQQALKINPLYARTWFALGCALVREERWEEAREAFSRQVGIEAEDGEGWNNLAAVYLRMPTDASKKGRSTLATREGDDDDEEDDTKAGEEEEEEVSADGIPFANKRLAFRALQTGLRFSRDNWRMWQNYMIVAIDVGEMAEAARAQSRLVEDKRDKDARAVVDEAVLSKLVDAVTREDWNGGAGSLADGQIRTSNEGLGLLPIVDRLFDVVILPRCATMPSIYTIQARLKRWQEDWAGALDCYLKAYRAGIAADERVEREIDRFREAVEDMGELIDLMRSLGPRAKAQEEQAGLVKGQAQWRDWRFQARTLVRTFMGRTRDIFGDDADFDKLKEMLEELKA